MTAMTRQETTMNSTDYADYADYADECPMGVIAQHNYADPACVWHADRNEPHAPTSAGPCIVCPARECDCNETRLAEDEKLCVAFGCAGFQAARDRAADRRFAHYTATVLADTGHYPDMTPK